MPRVRWYRSARCGEYLDLTYYNREVSLCSVSWEIAVYWSAGRAGCTGVYGATGEDSYANAEGTGCEFPQDSGMGGEGLNQLAIHQCPLDP